VAALGAIGSAVVISFSQGEEPEPLQDLQRAQQAGERAGAASRRIVANLERIESNLQQGAGLSDETGTIRDLTSRQSRSLENLVDLLSDQLETLQRTERTLRGTQRSAADVGRLGATQLDVLRRTLAALRQLEGDVRFSTRTSGELSRLALYGARLAEDSQKRFSDP
jgi:hypothetical protein